MLNTDDGAYYRKRQAQEMEASEKATDPMIKRLHWEIAQRYAFLASEQEEMSDAEEMVADLTPDTPSL